MDPCKHCVSVPSGDGIIHERGCQRHEVGFAKFTTWRDVLEWARAGKPLYYHAPLNISPVRLWPGVPVRGAAFYSVRPRTIRITPPDAHGRGKARTADPFTADAGHLDRFRRPAEVQP